MKDFFKYLMATVCGLLLFSILGFVLLISSLVSMVAVSATSDPTVLSDHSVYRLELRGNVSERVNENDYSLYMQRAMGGDDVPNYGLNDILRAIREAKDNPSIDGIYLKGGSLSCGYTTAQAIRDALEDFRSSGKFVVAYADQYSQRSYYIASVADRVLCNPSGSVAWQGMGVTLQFYPRLLEKLGVEMQVVKVGTFKSAVEPYILTGMSEANRLQYEVMLGDMWGYIKQDVARSRSLSVETLDSLADCYMAFQPQTDYVVSGLVDSLCYLEDVEAVLTAYCGTNDYTLVSHSEMLALPKESSKAKEQVAVLYAEGNITDESGDGIVGKKMVREINRLRRDESVKAVVLRVNSGGGSAYASEQIHHALTLLQEEKPLVVSMGDYAASGGYYISCHANQIFAEPTTLTGSIGIFGVIPSFAGLAGKVGVDFDQVATNRHANLDNNMVMLGMNPGERELLQQEICRGYDLFTRRCAEGRHVSQDSIKAIAEGRVWSGIRAQQIGLVDSLGSLQDAVTCAARLAELEDYAVVDAPKAKTALEQFLEMLDDVTTHDKVLERHLGKAAYRELRYLEQLRDQPTVQARLEALPLFE